MEKKIDEFKLSDEVILTFEEILTGKDRLAIHDYCEKVGLYSKSEGSGHKRTTKVYKVKPEDTGVEITDEDRKIFIKDFGFPIPVYKEPYFTYYVNSLDPLFGSVKSYNMMVDAVTKLESQGKKFFKYTHELAGKMIKAISEKEEYQKFVTEKCSYPCEDYPPEESIYKKDAGTHFFSLDIIKANYNCLRVHDKKIVLDTNDWIEFVKKFTDIEYFFYAKYFRQNVFGKLSSKRIQLVQKSLLTELYKKIKGSVSVYGRMGSDELFVNTTQETWVKDLELLKKLISEMDENVRNIWKISAFSLKQLGKSANFVLTDLEDGTFEFANVPKDFHLQAYKFYMNIPLEENDFKAMKDDYVVTYGEPYDFN